MTKKRLYFILLVGLVLLLASCVPKAKQVPGPTPAAPQVAPTMTALAVSPEEAAWEKVVAAAKKEGMVVFYAVTYSGEDAQIIANAFYRKYGIKLETIGGAGASYLERLTTEKRMGQMTGDLLQAGPGQMVVAKRMGLLSRVADLPSIQNKALWEVDPLVIDPDGFLAAYEGSWMGPVINTKLVPEGSEPKSLKDLLKPEWKGKILFVSPMTSSVSHIYYVAFINRGLIDWSYVEALGKQVGGWSQGSMDTPRIIAKGDFSIANWVSSNAGSLVVLEGGPIKAVSLEEGDPFSLNMLGVVERAPHSNAAKVFLNWFYSKEAALLVQEKTKLVGGESLLKGVPSGIPKALIPPLKKRVVFSQKDLDEGATLYTEQFLAKLFKLK